MAAPPVIRPVAEDDFDEWAPLWAGYNHFYGRIGDTALPDPINFSRAALKVVLDQGGERIESASCRRYSAHLDRLDEGSGSKRVAGN